MKLNVFLDLEETVIDDWFSCCFLNNKIEKIKNLINKFSLEFLNEKANENNVNLILFSAAVTNEEDLKEFNKFIKPILEEKLELKFNEVVMFDNKTIFGLAKKCGIKPTNDDTIHDIFMFNIKEEVFNLVVKKNEINILFDDTVEDKICFEGLSFLDKNKSLLERTKESKTTKLFVNMS